MLSQKKTAEFLIWKEAFMAALSGAARARVPATPEDDVCLAARIADRAVVEVQAKWAAMEAEEEKRVQGVTS